MAFPTRNTLLKFNGVANHFDLDVPVNLRWNRNTTFFRLVTREYVKARVIIYFDDPWLESSINENVEPEHLEAVSFHCFEIDSEQHLLPPLSERLDSYNSLHANFFNAFKESDGIDSHLFHYT